MTDDLRRAVGEAAMQAATLFVDKIRAFYDVKEVIAFGSRVRGDNRSDSDFDLAVVLNGDHGDFIDPKLKMADQAFDVLLETGILVQPLPLWMDDLVSESQFPNPSLIRNIADKGIMVGI